MYRVKVLMTGATADGQRRLPLCNDARRLGAVELLISISLLSWAVRASTNRPDAFDGNAHCPYFGAQHGLFEPDVPRPRFIVTGGAGFIGSHLVKKLAEKHGEGQVKVVDNLWRGALRNLQEESGSWVIRPTLDFCFLDLRDAASTAKYLRGADVIYHLADIVAGINYVFNHQEALFSDNMLINVNTLNAAKSNKIGDFLYVGTACSFPAYLQMGPGVHALRENQTYPAEPESSYGWSKLMGEYHAELAKSEDFRVGLLRLHNVYGPHTEYSPAFGQAIPALIRKALVYPKEDFIVWGSGKQYRDFIYVDDVVEALLALHRHGLNKGVIQVGNGQAVTLATAAQAVLDACGHHNLTTTFDKTKPEGDRGRIAVLDRAHDILGWKAQVDLATGIQRTVNWMQHDIMRPKVLVILIGQARGGDLAWKSLHKHLLEPLDAHLALMFTETQQPTMLHELAQYSWTVPEYRDWGDVLDQAAAQCQPEPDRMPWRRLCDVPDQFLGGVENCSHPASAGILLAFRWLVQQKIREYHLDTKYDWMIWSRADELYACDHPAVQELDPKYVYLPEGEHYGGWSDRHFVSSSAVFTKAINITSELVCNPEKWRSALLADIAQQPGGGGAYNLEGIQKALWADSGVSVQEYKRPMFTVRTKDDPTRWSGGTDHALLAEYDLKVKYNSALTLVLDHCTDVPKALAVIQDHHPRRSNLKLRHSHAAKP